METTRSKSGIENGSDDLNQESDNVYLAMRIQKKKNVEIEYGYPGIGRIQKGNLELPPGCIGICYVFKNRESLENYYDKSTAHVTVRIEKALSNEKDRERDNTGTDRGLPKRKKHTRRLRRIGV